MTMVLTPKDKHDIIVKGIKTFFKEAGFKKAVLGLSGGIDSALVACLAVEALGARNVVGVTLPSRYSSDESKELAEELGKNLGMKVFNCCIEDALELFEHTVEKSYDMPLKGIPNENVQARIRMVYLMAYANMTDSLLLDTGNRTEFLLGYATIYGDQAGSLAPIGDLNKVEVYEVSDYVMRKGKGIPFQIMERKPSAELSDGQVDPFDYDVVSGLTDEIASNHGITKEMKKKYPKKLLDRLAGLIKKSEWKRDQCAPSIPVEVLV